MRIKTGLRALAMTTVMAGSLSAGVAHADAPDLPLVLRLINTATSQCLTAHTQGAYVGQAPCNGSPAQNWQVWNDHWHVQDQADGNCLRLVPGSGSIDTVPCDWHFQDGNQHWVVDTTLSPSAVVSQAPGSGFPLLAAVGSTNVLASFNGSGNISWYH